MVATVHTLPEFWLWAEREVQMTFRKFVETLFAFRLLAGTQVRK